MRRPHVHALKIALYAGEPSGDVLGAGLMRALRARQPRVEFMGVGGPRMTEAGLDSLCPLEAVAVMGLFEILGHLPFLLRLRRRLVSEFAGWRPDVFIGIDAPDFNLGLERRLRRSGIKTMHYVSPSVWAWRQGRVKTIAAAVDRMLTLFPFEATFYEKQGVPVTYVGHPLADAYPLGDGRDDARARLDLARDGPVIALLPGSRRSEVERLGPIFAAAAALLLRSKPSCRFVSPMATPSIRARFAQFLRASGISEQVRLIDGHADQAMAASDIVLVASGTATLEAMLLKRPMVMAYKVAPLTYHLLRVLGVVKIRRFALPNLLADEDLVPEFIQDSARPEALCEALRSLLEDQPRRQRIRARFLDIHHRLRRGADARAAESVLKMAGLGS